MSPNRFSTYLKMSVSSPSPRALLILWPQISCFYVNVIKKRELRRQPRLLSRHKLKFLIRINYTRLIDHYNHHSPFFCFTGIALQNVKSFLSAPAHRFQYQFCSNTLMMILYQMHSMVVTIANSFLEYIW